MRSKNFYERGQRRNEKFNFTAIQLSEAEWQSSDKRNGYFLVGEGWGTCFFSTHEKNEFRIWFENEPKVERTYTTIPAHLADRVWWCSLNWKPTDGRPSLLYPSPGCRVVGIHDPITHALGGWVTQTCLVYCPGGLPPTAEFGQGFSNIPSPRILAAGRQAKRAIIIPV